MSLSFGLGTNNQATAVAAKSPQRIGCRTETPALAAMSPVTMGKKHPPIWARTKTKAKAVEWISGENN